MKMLSEKLKTAPRRVRAALFGAYIAVMLYLLLIGGRSPVVTDYWAQFRENLNLIPFDSLIFFFKRLFSHDSAKVIHAVKNLVGNVVLFFPLGFCLPWTVPKCGTIRGTLITAGLGITAVEITQVVTLRGFCDIDDLALNLIGVWIGYKIYKSLIGGEAQ